MENEVDVQEATTTEQRAREPYFDLAVLSLHAVHCLQNVWGLYFRFILWCMNISHTLWTLWQSMLQVTLHSQEYCCDMYRIKASWQPGLFSLSVNSFCPSEQLAVIQNKSFFCAKCCCRVQLNRLAIHTLFVWLFIVFSCEGFSLPVMYNSKPGSLVTSLDTFIPNLCNQTPCSFLW